jgi:hypothetical protein
MLVRIPSRARVNGWSNFGDLSAAYSALITKLHESYVSVTREGGHSTYILPAKMIANQFHWRKPRLQVVPGQS